MYSECFKWTLMVLGWKFLCCSLRRLIVWAKLCHMLANVTAWRPLTCTSAKRRWVWRWRGSSWIHITDKVTLVASTWSWVSSPDSAAQKCPFALSLWMICKVKSFSRSHLKVAFTFKTTCLWMKSRPLILGSELPPTPKMLHPPLLNIL